jgi:hypothetical protein
MSNSSAFIDFIIAWDRIDGRAGILETLITSVMLDFQSEFNWKTGHCSQHFTFKAEFYLLP